MFFKTRQRKSSQPVLHRSLEKKGGETFLPCDVTFVRRRQARRIKISVATFQGVRISVPYGVAWREAEAFLDQKRAWIVKQITWVKQLEEEHARQISAAVPLDREAASRRLKERVAELARHFGFSVQAVSVRAPRTRWGSCSQRNNISLNIQLMRLPDDLRDYVILHELVHTRIKNHSKVFWELLDQTAPGAKALDRRLRQYHTWLL